METKLPAIVCDIDGVILRGSLVIGNSDNMIKQILKPQPNGKCVPFTLLTNGGGFTEERKAEEINKKLGLEGSLKIDHTQVIQCHTPLREKALVDRYKDKYVLVCGSDEVLSAALAYGYEKAIHVDELAAVYPNSVPMDIPILKEDTLAAVRKDLETRFGKSIDELKEELVISAIFIMHDVIYSDLTVQLFSDILASKTGHILGERRKPGDPQVVQLYSTNPDLVWPYQWPIPRYGPKTFIIALEAIFKAYYGLEI